MASKGVYWLSQLQNTCCICRLSMPGVLGVESNVGGLNVNKEDKYDDKHIDPFLSHTLITGILKTLAFSLVRRGTLIVPVSHGWSRSILLQIRSIQTCHKTVYDQQENGSSSSKLLAYGSSYLFQVHNCFLPAQKITRRI